MFDSYSMLSPEWVGVRFVPTRDPWLENLSVRFLKSRNNGKLPPAADFRDVVSQNVLYISVTGDDRGTRT